MNELVFRSEKGNPVTNSLLVAEKFGKRHSDILISIEGLINQTPKYQAECNFALSTYTDTCKVMFSIHL
jgi:phage regulator Rha-like protein